MNRVTNPEAFDDESSNFADSIAALAMATANPQRRIIGSPMGIAFLTEDSLGGEALRLVDEMVAESAESGRIVAKVNVDTAESLQDYVNAYKGDSSVLFASLRVDRIVCILDYHEDQDRSEKLRQRFCNHVATLTLPLSLEWQAWTGIDGQMMDQLTFCRFLEDNREDINSPDAASVLEACRDLQGLRNVDFRSVAREDSDNVAIEYKDERSTASKNGSTSLPAEFTLAIPVYFCGEVVKVAACLRWRLSDDGALTLGFALRRAERIKQETFHAAVEKISDATQVPAIYGRPHGET